MLQHEIFNIEKIKEMISCFNDLQVSYKLLNSLLDDRKSNKVEKKFAETFNGDINNLELISNSIENLIEDLLIITEDNVNSFNIFQNELISKFKREYNDNLKNLELNNNNLQQIGKSLIKSRKISRVIWKVSYIHSIKLNQWLELIDSLKQNSTFKMVIHKLDRFHQNLIENKLNERLKDIGGNFDDSIINDFKKSFYDDPHLTFLEFLQSYENKLSKEDIDEKKSILKREREKLELEKLIKTQEEQNKLYQDYLRLSKKEFERKRRRERREELNKIDLKSKNNNKLEISKETSEKIEKFKSSFDKSYKDDYLIQESEEKSPLELIRERKKKKSEEYKKYKKHFEAE